MEKVKEIGYKFLKKRNVQQGDSVMFDIDNTLLDRETLEPYQPIIDLSQMAIALGYKVVIITARPDNDEVQSYTANQLREIGVEYTTLGFIGHQMKGDMKKYLKSRGHNFILSVGDMWTDLTETTHWIKLPDTPGGEFKTSIAYHNLDKIQTQSLVHPHFLSAFHNMWFS